MSAEEEERQLQEFSDEIAGKQKSPFEPRCIARAFASRLMGDVVFTMQTWIDLEAIRSPLLLGLPCEDAVQLEHAAAAFGMSLSGLNETDAALALIAMNEAIADAFALALPMRPEGQASERDDGFGTWLLIYGRLVSECHCDPDAALRMDVGRAFALLAAVRSNQGWHPSGQPYNLRDAEEKEDTHG